MDELLLRRAKNGDPEAFEQLMTPLENQIWRICWHYMGERESTADCGQETMIRVWKGLAQYREESSFESWVYRIAANCCLDQLRKRKRDRSESIEPLKEQGFDPPDPEADTEARVVARDERQRLREAIAQLPEDQRDALVLTQLEGVSYEQAAAMLGATEGTIKSRVSRAKARLKELMLRREGGANEELSSAPNVSKRGRRERS